MLGLKKIVSLVELDSPYGHDAFLLEIGNLERVICSFINNAETCGMHCVDTGSGGGSLQKDNASAIFDASDDYRFLTRLIEPKSHILDIGCGNGELIDNLYASRKTTGFGIDINLENLIECLIKNVPVVHGDVDNGLTLFGDNTFDYAVLSQTMQMLKKPAFVLKEMLRVAKHGIIIFPNLGNIRHRALLALGGVSPLTVNSDPWWQTANIRLFSLKDFQVLCANLGFVIDQAIPVSRSRLSATLCRISGLANLGADVIVAKISRCHQHEVEES
jgi:homoserine O-acetyltransferase